MDAYLEVLKSLKLSNKTWWTRCGRLLNVNWQQVSTTVYHLKMSSCLVLFKIPEYKFVLEVVSYDDAVQTATIRQRNVINEGDQVEFYGPGFHHFETYIEDLHDPKGNKIDRAPNPMELLTIKVPPTRSIRRHGSCIKRRTHQFFIGRWNQRHSSSLRKEKE